MLLAVSAKARKKQRECHLEKNQYHYIFYFPNNPYLFPAGNLFAAKLILEIVGPQTTESGVQGSNPASLTVENSVYTELYCIHYTVETFLVLQKVALLV